MNFVHFSEKSLNFHCDKCPNCVTSYHTLKQLLNDAIQICADSKKYFLSFEHETNRTIVSFGERMLLFHFEDTDLPFWLYHS